MSFGELGQSLPYAGDRAFPLPGDLAGRRHRRALVGVPDALLRAGPRLEPGAAADGHLRNLRILREQYAEAQHKYFYDPGSAWAWTLHLSINHIKGMRHLQMQ